MNAQQVIFFYKKSYIWLEGLQQSRDRTQEAVKGPQPKSHIYSDILHFF